MYLVVIEEYKGKKNYLVWEILVADGSLHRQKILFNRFENTQ